MLAQSKGFRTAGTGMDLDDRIGSVVLTYQQGLEFHGLGQFLEPGDAVLQVTEDLLALAS